MRKILEVKIDKDDFIVEINDDNMDIVPNLAKILAENSDLRMIFKQALVDSDMIRINKEEERAQTISRYADEFKNIDFTNYKIKLYRILDLFNIVPPPNN